MVETPVGDRHVLTAMEEHDLVLGGEQSGHLIFAEHAVTGDGPLAGILLLDTVARAGVPLSELAAVVTKYPQVLENVRVRERDGLDAADRRSGPRSARSRRTSATRAGCWCARRAPSRWCGSWSRPAIPPSPRSAAARLTAALRGRALGRRERDASGT